MCMHTVEYSVQPSKGKYSIRVYYERIVYIPQKNYTCIVYHTYITYMHTPPPPPEGGMFNIYKQTVL